MLLTAKYDENTLLKMVVNIEDKKIIVRQHE